MYFKYIKRQRECHVAKSFCETTAAAFKYKAEFIMILWFLTRVRWRYNIIIQHTAVTVFVGIGYIYVQYEYFKKIMNLYSS